jgi:hypothetical protein
MIALLLQGFLTDKYFPHRPPKDFPLSLFSHPQKLSPAGKRGTAETALAEMVPLRTQFPAGWAAFQSGAFRGMGAFPIR